MSAASVLTEAHRLAQIRVGIATMRQLGTVWPLLDPENLNDTTARWLRASAGVVQAQRRTSSALAAAYYRRHRQLSIGSAGPVPRFAPPAPTGALLTSLTVTGPVRIKAAMRAGRGLAPAVVTAKAGVARAGMRHTLNGGRETLTETVRSDDQAFGWARVADADPCAFCAMLASRGPVYGEDTVGFPAHDGCSCGVQPVWSEDDPWPPGSRELQDLWERSTVGKSGDDAMRAFRDALEGDELPSLPGEVPVPTPPAPAGPMGISPADGTTKPSERVFYATPKAEQAFGHIVERLDQIVGLPDDGINPVRVVLGAKAQSKGGHFSPNGTVPKKDRRILPGETRDQAQARVDEIRKNPEIRAQSLRVEAGHEKIAFLHEFGHRTDWEGTVGYGGATYNTGRLGAGRSAEVDAFLKAATGNDHYVWARREALKSGTGYYQYFNQSIEVWARAYAQWSVGKVNLPDVTAVFAANQARVPMYSWPKELFDREIAPKLEAVLRSRGMIQ